MKTVGSRAQVNGQPYNREETSDKEGNSTAEEG